MSVRYPHCRNQEMEHKFLNSKILHVVYILLPPPHDYTSADVPADPFVPRLYSTVKKIGVECVLRQHQKVVFEKKRRIISHIIHKFVLI